MALDRWVVVVFFPYMCDALQIWLPVSNDAAAAYGNLLSISSQVIIGAKKDWGVCFNQSNKLLI